MTIENLHGFYSFFFFFTFINMRNLGVNSDATSLKFKGLKCCNFAPQSLKKAPETRGM